MDKVKIKNIKKFNLQRHIYPFTSQLRLYGFAFHFLKKLLDTEIFFERCNKFYLLFQSAKINFCNFILILIYFKN